MYSSPQQSLQAFSITGLVVVDAVCDLPNMHCSNVTYVLSKQIKTPSLEYQNNTTALLELSFEKKTNKKTNCEYS